MRTRQGGYLQARKRDVTRNQVFWCLTWESPFGDELPTELPGLCRTKAWNTHLHTLQCKTKKWNPYKTVCGIELLRLLRLWGCLLQQIVNITLTNTDHARKWVGTKPWSKYFLMQLPKTFERFSAACPQSLPGSTLQGWPFLYFQPICATPASKYSQVTVTSNPRHGSLLFIVL